MIAIDLLKGEGRPVKSRPGWIAMMTLPFVIPIIAGIFLAGMYLGNKVTLQVQMKKLVALETKSPELIEIEQLIEESAEQRKYLNSCFKELNDTIGSHIQWSPALATLAKYLPEKVFIHRLEVFREKLRKKVPQPDDPQKFMYINKYKYTLRVTVDTKTENDNAIQGYIKQLRFAETLASQLEDVRIVTQQSVSENEVDFKRYEIDCVFKLER